MVPLTIDFANLHTILATLYDDMLPLCKDMMDVGKARGVGTYNKPLAAIADLPGWVPCSMSPSACGSRWPVPNR